MDFDELLEHLDDLVALADNEGFLIAAAALSSTREIIAQRQSVYAHRGEVDESIAIELRRLVAGHTARKRAAGPS